MDKKKTRRRVLTAVAASLAALALGGALLLQYFYGLLDVRPADTAVHKDAASLTTLLERETGSESTDKALPPGMAELMEAEPIAHSGVYNLLLIGTDSRQDNFKGRTDTMILVSIHEERETIVVSSFLRDTHVCLPGFGYDRMNAANVVGGPDMLMETVRYNFGLTVDDYAFVNFYSFIDIVDALGGIDVTLTPEEMYYVNQCIYQSQLPRDQYPMDFLYEREDGQYHLNGVQTLGFCRMRNVGSDPGRAERQRLAVSLLWEKVRQQKPLTLLRMAEALLPEITTDISRGTFFSLLASAAEYSDYTIVTQQIPAKNTYGYDNVNGKSVIAANFKENRRILQETIYGVTEE